VNLVFSGDFLMTGQEARLQLAELMYLEFDYYVTNFFEDRDWSRRKMVTPEVEARYKRLGEEVNWYAYHLLSYPGFYNEMRCFELWVFVNDWVLDEGGRAIQKRVSEALTALGHPTEPGNWIAAGFPCTHKEVARLIGALHETFAFDLRDGRLRMNVNPVPPRFKDLNDWSHLKNFLGKERMATLPECGNVAAPEEEPLFTSRTPPSPSR
jgi:hypothetical protein